MHLRISRLLGSSGHRNRRWRHGSNAKRDPAGRTNENPSAKEIFQLAKSGDALAQKAVERENYYLGLGIANLINLFMPEMIVLGGSIMKSVQLADLAKVVAQGCRFVPFQLTQLALASLGDDANLIGAARVWHARFASGSESG